MAYNRELSQFASFIEVGINSIGIKTSVGIGTTAPLSILHLQSPSSFTTFGISGSLVPNGLYVANNYPVTYPTTTSNFSVYPGIINNINLDTSQTINSVTPGGFNFVYGMRNLMSMGTSTTSTDLTRLYITGFQNEVSWASSTSTTQILATNNSVIFSGASASLLSGDTVRLFGKPNSSQTVTTITAPAVFVNTGISSCNYNITNVRNFFANGGIGIQTTGVGNTITITDFEHFVSAYDLKSGGAGGTTNITNLYGLRLKTSSISTTTTITNNWGISQEWSSARNYFAGNVLVGSATSTGTSSQLLQVTGGAYVSGSVGIGTTNPRARLQVDGDVSIASTVGIGTIIDIIPYDTLNSGTLSFEGSAGQLFSITNNLTSGSIFSVNDVSGIPSIDVNADGTILLAPYGNNEKVGIGTTAPLSILHLQSPSSFTTFGNLVPHGLYVTNNYPVSYPSTSSFTLAPGILNNINLDTSQTINSVTPGGFNFVYGIRNNVSISTLSTSTDLTRLYAIGCNNTVSWASTAPTNQILGLSDTITFGGSSAITLSAQNQINLTGISSSSQTVTNAHSPSLNVNTGLSSYCNYNIANWRGFFTQANIGFQTTGVGNTITITNFEHFTNSNYNLNSGGTGGTTNITNLYGLRLVTPNSISTTTTITNNWGISQEWSSARNYFAGNVLVGSAASTGTSSQLLQVTGGAYVSGSVGIGTTNPISNLHVQGNALISGISTILSNSSGDALRINQIGSGNALVVEDETNPDSTPFIITGIGSVGIGTTAPLSILHLQSPSSFTTFGNLVPNGLYVTNNYPVSYPSTTFVLNPGILNNINLDTSQTINSVTYGFPFVHGIKNNVAISSLSTSTDLSRLCVTGFSNDVSWASTAPVYQLLGTSENVTFSGTSAVVVGGDNVRLRGPANSSQTISSSVQSRSFTIVTASGLNSCTYNIAAVKNVFATNAIGFSTLGVGNTISITNFEHFTNSSLFLNSGGTGGTTNITNLYGLRLVTPNSISTTTTITNNWGISQEWSSARNYFAGNVLVGSATSTGTSLQLLQVTGGAYVSGSVGIGITNPTQKLHIFGDINGPVDASISNGNTGTSAYTQFLLTNDGSTLVLQNNALSRTVSRFGSAVGGWGELYLLNGNGLKLGTSSATPLVLGTNNTEALRIDSSQRVGIGTTNPSSRIHIQNNHTLSAASQIALIENTASGEPASLAFLSIADNLAQGNQGAIYFDAGSTGVSNDNRLQFTADHQNSIIPQMTLTGAGNVGIGGTDIVFFETRLIVEGTEVTSPGLVNQLGPLYVYNSTNNADTVAPKSSLTIGRNGKSSVSYGNYVNFNLGRYSQVGTAANTQLTLRLNNGNTNDPDTDVMTLLASGNVGIGLTNPSKKLSVYNGSILVGTTPTSNTTGEYEVFRGFAYETGGVQYGSVVLKSNYDSGTNTATLNFYVSSGGTNQGVERLRIDSAGRVLVGTSTARSNLFNSTGSSQLQVEGTTSDSSSILVSRSSATTDGSYLILGHSRSAGVSSNTVLVANDVCGTLSYQGNDGTEFVESASILTSIDGNVGLNSMPGRIVLSTTGISSSIPTERLRITNNGVLAYNQPAPTTKNTAATLTIAELQTGIIQYTGNAQTLTLPTGTLSEGGFSGIYTNMAFQWSVINTGSGTCTIGAATGHTIVGSAAVAINVSARFASRRTAANTFVTYRLS